MAIFFAVLTIIGFSGLLISLIMLASNYKPLALWVTLICICGMMLLSGAIGGVIIEEGKISENPIVQEQVGNNYEQYILCFLQGKRPYVGSQVLESFFR